MVLRIFRSLIVITVVSVLLVSCCPNLKILNDTEHTSIRPLEVDLNESIDTAALYLQRNCDQNGRFTYLRHRDKNVNYGEKYNLLRHAGTMYALVDYYKSNPNTDLSDFLVRASAYLRTFIAPVATTGEGAYAVWTIPERLGSDDTSALPYAKLGGSGLGLVALSGVEAIKPGTVPLDELRGLGQFVLFMQNLEGRFYSRYSETFGYDTQWVSLYYPGEACLGLLMLYDIDPDLRWLNAAAQGLGYLARSRKGVENVPADHWALIATEKILPKIAGMHKPAVNRKELIDHAKQILEVILSQQKPMVCDPSLLGSFLNDARTTPTATRLEGTLAALRFLPADMTDLRERLERASDHGMAFLMRHQIIEGPLQGGMPRAARQFQGISRNAKFNERVGEVRIDYVQHALSAMMGYREYVYADI